jgi:hypothetical protein
VRLLVLGLPGRVGGVAVVQLHSVRMRVSLCRGGPGRAGVVAVVAVVQAHSVRMRVSLCWMALAGVAGRVRASWPAAVQAHSVRMYLS